MITKKELATKLGYKSAKDLDQALLDMLLENVDNISSVENIGKAIKLYSSNGIAQRNQKQSQETLEKIENAIKECLEEGKEPTKTYLNKRYGIFYETLKKYQLENPGKIVESKPRGKIK